MIDIIVARRYWFVSCIMLYYIAIYFVSSFLRNRIFLISLLVAIGTAIWFYFIYQKPGFSMYSGHYIRWLLFFDFMLLGAKMGTVTDKIKIQPIPDMIMLLLSIILFYVLFLSGLRIKSMAVAQYFSFIPLLGAMYYFYKVGASCWAEKIYRSKIGNFFIRFVGGLCLEIYMVQHFLFTDKMNNIFPLNIVIMFVIIFIVAYLTRCLARFISQTFKDAPYDWMKIVSLY